MNGNTNGTNGSTNGGNKHLDDLDHILVGAGFGGTLMLWRLRELGFRAHLIESTDRTGGVWSSKWVLLSSLPVFRYAKCPPPSTATTLELGSTAVRYVDRASPR